MGRCPSVFCPNDDLPGSGPFHGHRISPQGSKRYDAARLDGLLGCSRFLKRVLDPSVGSARVRGDNSVASDPADAAMARLQLTGDDVSTSPPVFLYPTI